MWHVGDSRSAAEAQRWMVGEEEEKNMQQEITCVNMLTGVLRFVLVLTHYPSCALKLLTPVESTRRTLAFPGHSSPQHLVWLPRLEHPIDCTATLK